MIVSSKNNPLYRSMIQWRRHWQADRWSCGWPGKAVKAPAETRYPNLVAELDWSCPWLHIMAAALEDNEELSPAELGRLSRYLDVPLGYLTAPKFAMIDPATNRGKAKRRELADLLKQANGLDFWRWKVEDVLSQMDSGAPVTYASYRWAVGELRSAADRHQREQHKPRSRRRAATA